MVSRSAASALPENSLEMKILGPISDLQIRNSGRGACFHKPCRGLQSCYHMRTVVHIDFITRGVQPAAHRPHQPGMAMNVAQHKVVNLLKTFFLLISFH